MGLVVKNPPASAGDLRDSSLVPGLGSSLRGGHGDPLQYSCLKSPMDRGAWQATVHGVTKSCTVLKRLSTHTYRHTHTQTHTHADKQVTQVLPLPSCVPVCESLTCFPDDCRVIL